MVVRRAGLWLCMTGFVVGSLELASLFGLRIVEGRWMLPGAVRAERLQIEDQVSPGVDQKVVMPPGDLPDRPSGGPRDVLHPYLGYVYAAPTEAETAAPDPLRGLGFPADATPIPQPGGPDDFIVLIFGGSVAKRFEPMGGAAALVARLETLPEAAGKRIHVGTVALGGYKQPQQLLALAYLASLGFRADLVLNLDGFNEATLGPTENVPRGVATFFPRLWWLRVQDTPDRRRQAILGETVVLRARRTRWAQALGGPILGHSATATLAWRLLDGRLAERVALLERAMVDEAPSPVGIVAPPHPTARDSDALADEIASVWKASSLQMSHLAAAGGARYFHFLQPNQYFRGSKPMNEQELRLAVGRPSPLDTWVNRVYPRLIEAGSELQDSGVAFFDLTQVFSRTADPLYTDKCCHFSPRGYGILGQAMAEAIATPWSRAD